MGDSPSVRLLWAVHCHQPVGNFDFVFEHAFENAYKPFVEVVERFPEIGVDFHFSGILLDWLDKNRPEYLDRVGALVSSGQCGLLAGAYYEPILPPIPRHDQIGQIVALRKRLLGRFGVEPRGMWLAERVWEPGLPEALAEAGILDVAEPPRGNLPARFRWGRRTLEEVVRDCPGLPAMGDVFPNLACPRSGNLETPPINPMTPERAFSAGPFRQTEMERAG